MCVRNDDIHKDPEVKIAADEIRFVLNHGKLLYQQCIVKELNCLTYLILVRYLQRVNPCDLVTVQSIMCIHFVRVANLILEITDG